MWWWNEKTRGRRLRALGVLVLLLGLGASAWVYSHATDTDENVIGYEIVDGLRTPIHPGESKSYLRNLELQGGKAAVLADAARRWFLGLWHGKQLALVLFLAAVLVAAILFYLADHPFPDGPPSPRGLDETDEEK